MTWVGSERVVPDHLWTRLPHRILNSPTADRQDSCCGYVSLTGYALPGQASTMRARCERTAVERCREPFGDRGDFGSAMLNLSIAVRRGRAIGWVCKPEVTGSIPVRSTCRSGRFA